jgi:hypothetical protein
MRVNWQSKNILIIGAVGIFLFISSHVFAQTTATVDITNPADGDVVRKTVSIQAEVSVSYAFSQTPTPGPRSSGFGMRGGRLHQGVDTADPQGIPVEAVMRGTAYIYQNFTPQGGYGYLVVIDHGNGLYTLYGHLDSYNVTHGQQVSVGDVISYSGNTGGSPNNPYGDHLHFGVWNGYPHVQGSTPVNPDNYLPTARIRVRSAIDGNVLHTQDHGVGITNINYSTDWDTTQVNDGGHAVSVSALRLSTLANGSTDEYEVGNSSINVNVDNTPPTISNLQLEDGTLIRRRKGQIFIFYLISLKINFKGLTTKLNSLPIYLLQLCVAIFILGLRNLNKR